MKSKLGKAAYILLSFLLSVALFLLTYSVVFQITLLNPSYIIDNMNTGSYYSDKSDEIRTKLVDLGNASGIEAGFFDGVVDDVMVCNDTQAYVKACYEGGEPTVDSGDFVQALNTALDEYIAANDVKTTDSNRDYFVKQASSIYSSSLRLPLFITLSPYLTALKNAIPFIVVGLAAFSAILLCVIIFTNKWKHRGVRCACYAVGGSFLSIGILPAVLLISGFAKKINLESHAVYNLFVSCFNSVCVALVICSAVMLIIAVGMFFLHKQLRKRATN